MKNSEDKIIYNLITTRHSCRKFLQKEIPQEFINKIIECGLSAPSAMNKQPWHFVLIKDKQVINNLTNLARKSFLTSDVEWRINWASKEDFSPFYNPDSLILICNNNQIKNSKNDCCFAVENMSLMASSLGLGSCIIQDICWAINNDNQETFEIPKNFSIYLSLAIGYPEKNSQSIKNFDKSKITIL